MIGGQKTYPQSAYKETIEKSMVINRSILDHYTEQRVIYFTSLRKQ